MNAPFVFVAVFAIDTMQGPQSTLAKKDSSNILKDDFSLRTDSFIFTSIPPK